MGCCGNGRPKVRTLTMVEKAKNLALSAANAIGHAVQTGKLKADDSVIEKRVAVCKACRHLTGNKCSICGCFLVAKTALASEKCPLKLW